MIKNMRIILMESRVDSARILEILTASKPANKDDPNYNYYKVLADWANPGRNQAGKEINLDKSNTQIKISDRSLIDKNPTKLAKRYNNLGALLSVLKSLMDSAGYNPNNAASKLIQKTTVEILASLSGKFPKKEQPETPQGDSSNLRQGMDWTAEKARRLANPNGKATSEILDQFYNDYYKIEYAGLSSPAEEDSTGIVAKLESLNTILIQEFNKLGYNPNVNPLAQFLKILIKEKPGIFKKLTTNTYGAIHNSFKDGYLKGNTLGNYNTKHLLFCEDLYSYKGLEMIEYLKLYKNALSATTEKETAKEDIWSLAATVFVHQKVASSSNTDEEQSTFTDKVNAILNSPNTIFPADPEAKLRSLSVIEELFTYIFDKSPKNEASPENENVKAVIQAVKAQKLAREMIQYIIYLDKFENMYPEETIRRQNMLGDFKASEKGLAKSEAALAPYIDELSENDLLSIVKACVNLRAKEQAAEK